MDIHHEDELLLAASASTPTYPSDTGNNIALTPQSQPSIRSLFLHLPIELRLHIYGYLIPRDRLVDVASPRFGHHDPEREDNQDPNAAAEVGEDTGVRCTYTVQCKAHYCRQDWTVPNYKSKLNNSIFLLSRQISEEALDVLYGDNIFKLCLDGCDELFLMEDFADTNWRRITKMLISVKPLTYEKMRRDTDEGFWAYMLPRLTHLRIVVDASRKGSGRWGSDAWRPHDPIAWLVPQFECLGRNLSSRTVLEVDVDGCEQMQGLVTRYLPGKHLKVECGIFDSLVLKSRLRLKLANRCWGVPDVTS